MDTVSRKELPLHEIVTLAARNPRRSNETLLTFCLVSKAFKNIAIPFLYEGITISTRSIGKSVRCLKALGENCMLARAVRVLSVYINDPHVFLNSFHRLVTRAIPHMSNLSRLNIRDYDRGVGRYLLEHRTLSRVRCWSLTLPSNVYQNSLPGFLVRHHHSLEVLSVSTTDKKLVVFPQTLTEGMCFSELETLELSWSSSLSLFVSGRFPSLQHVSFDFHHEKLAHGDVVSIVSLVVDWAKGQKEAIYLEHFGLTVGTGSDIDTAPFIDELSSAIPSLDSVWINFGSPKKFGPFLTEEARYRVGEYLARMPELRVFSWDDPLHSVGFDLDDRAIYEDIRLIQYFGEKCPTLEECAVPGHTYFWTRITGSAWAPSTYEFLYQLFYHKTYPAFDVLFRHLESASGSSPAVIRCMERYHRADARSREVTKDLMVMMVYLGAFDDAYDSDYETLKSAEKYDYEGRIRRLLTE